MIQTAAQLKGRIKNLSNRDSRRAENLMRIFFMERLLERISMSDYKDQFVLKGGMLAASLIGVDMRMTMDIDTTVRSLNLSEKNIADVIGGICAVDIGDHVLFELVQTETIMEEFEYPGIRVSLECYFEKIKQRIKIDISTDDVITPGAVEFEYKLMFEERSIQLNAYNTETLLAEKLQTILSRGTANTRMRDYYDVYMIVTFKDFSWDTLAAAFTATCSKRATLFSDEQSVKRLNDINKDHEMENSWNRFKEKNSYVGELQWEETFNVVNESIQRIVLLQK